MSEIKTELFKVVIAKEVAVDGINGWLDYKSIDPSIRTDHKQAVDKLVSAVMYGNLTIGDGGKLTHVLKFPIGEDGAIKSFDYKGRLTVDEVEACLGAGGSTKIYGAALTGKASGFFGKLDTSDLAILNAVVVFFIN